MVPDDSRRVGRAVEQWNDGLGINLFLTFPHYFTQGISSGVKSVRQPV